MTSLILTPSNRCRVSPFFERTKALGLKSCTIYNHMVLPLTYESVEADYRHLKSAVQLWDVGVQRQVEIVGPDALRLVQMSTPRDLSQMKDQQCVYIPNADAEGKIMNDPLLMRIGPNRFWASLADSDMLFYYKGLIAGFGLDAAVCEPDVSPLAIQGPKADDVIRKAFGQEAVETRFFRFKWVNVCGKPMILARSGWSLQGGFELYVDGSAHAEAAWDLLMEAGAEFNIRPGAPNGIERIEGGLISYGTDVTNDNTPIEAGLGAYCDLDSETEFLGLEALRKARTPKRLIRPLEIEGVQEDLPPCYTRWLLKDNAGNFAGTVSATAWSYDIKRHIAIAMVEADYLAGGTQLNVETPDGIRAATVQDRFWIRG